MWQPACLGKTMCYRLLGSPRASFSAHSLQPLSAPARTAWQENRFQLLYQQLYFYETALVNIWRIGL
jgi:hypothetical protein